MLVGVVKLSCTAPLVSADAVPMDAPLYQNCTFSPGWKPVPVTVTDVPAGACGTEKASAAAPWLTVNADVAEKPLARPVDSTAYWPGFTLGTVKVSANVPSLPACGVPTDWPLNVTSTSSVALKPRPLAVT